jgi:anti-anti-sigma regulatory factor
MSLPPMRNPPPVRTPDLKISERQVRDVTVLDLDGRITAREGGAVLRNAIRRLVREGKKKILLNFAKVGLIDATEAKEMVSTRSSVDKDGGQLKICCATSKVQDQLVRGSRPGERIGFVALTLNTFEKEQEALASFR